MVEIMELRVPAWRRSWCRYRPFVVAAFLLLEVFAAASLLMQASSEQSIFFPVLATAVLSILLKGHFARELSYHMSRYKMRIQAFRDSDRTNSRVAVARTKVSWIRTLFVLPMLSVASLVLYIAITHSILEHCSTALAISYNVCASCPHLPIVMLLLTLNASEIVESIADMLLSMALEFEDVFPGLKASVHVPAMIVRHVPLSMPDDAEKACAICLDDFMEGESVAQLACRHQFHDACLRKWFLRGSCCPFRCPVKGTSTIDSILTQEA